MHSHNAVIGLSSMPCFNESQWILTAELKIHWLLSKQGMEDNPMWLCKPLVMHVNRSQLALAQGLLMQQQCPKMNQWGMSDLAEADKN